MIMPRIRRQLKREFRRSLLAKIGVSLFAIILVSAMLAPLIAPHDPTEQNLSNSRLPPVGFGGEKNITTNEQVNGSFQTVTKTVQVNASMAYPLGTDQLGRDMLSRSLYGARTSLIVGLLGTMIAVTIGTTVGLVAGYYGGRVDDVLMRTSDTMLAFPGIVLAITLIGLFGTTAISIPDPFVLIGLAEGMPESFTIPGTIIAVIGLITWVQFARVARGEALTVSNEEYVKAAKAAGAANPNILRRHIFPNSLTPILVLATIQVAVIIIIESSLSFLGFSGTTLSWGYDIAQGREHLATSWWITMIPGIAIMLSVISINLVGDWIRDVLDPNLGGEGGQL